MLNDRYEQRLLLQVRNLKNVSSFPIKYFVQVIILYSLMSLLIIGWDAFKFCDPKGICHGKILGIVPVRLSRDWHNIAIQVCYTQKREFKRDSESINSLFYITYSARIILKYNYNYDST